MCLAITRFALTYKGLEHRTEWVEYPDIEALYKKLGIEAVDKRRDGSPIHTLPVIHDPSTNAIVADSYSIVKYLDETYPLTPALLPKDTLVFHAAFQAAWRPIQSAIFDIVVAAVCDSLNAPSQAYFRSTREEKFGARLEALNTPARWDELVAAWGRLRAFLARNGEGHDTLFGGQVGAITYADVQVAAALVWARNICGEESEDWKKIAGMDDGFWGRFLKQFLVAGLQKFTG